MKDLDEVIFINANAHKEFPEFYPPVGTKGTIVNAGQRYPSVRWSNGIGTWACGYEDIELVEKE